jgi:hypothetical protein
VRCEWQPSVLAWRKAAEPGHGRHTAHIHVTCGWLAAPSPGQVRVRGPVEARHANHDLNHLWRLKSAGTDEIGIQHRHAARTRRREIDSDPRIGCSFAQHKAPKHHFQPGCTAHERGAMESRRARVKGGRRTSPPATAGSSAAVTTTASSGSRRQLPLPLASGGLEGATTLSPRTRTAGMLLLIEGAAAPCSPAHVLMRFHTPCCGRRRYCAPATRPRRVPPPGAKRWGGKRSCQCLPRDQGIAPRRTRTSASAALQPVALSS